MPSLQERLGARLLGLKPGEVLTLRELTREFTAMKLEWAETLDFINHWAGRQAKRDAKNLKQTLAEPPAEAGMEPPPAGDISAHAAHKAALRQRAAQLRAANGGRMPVLRGEP